MQEVRANRIERLAECLLADMLPMAGSIADADTPATSFLLCFPQEQLKHSHCASRLCPCGFRFRRVVAMHEAGPSRDRSSPSGVRGPVLLPPCSRQRPFAMAGALHVPPPLRRFAPQRRHALATARPSFHEGRRGSSHILTTFPRRCAPHPGSDSGPITAWPPSSTSVTYWCCSTTTRCSANQVRTRCKVSMACWNVFIIRVAVPAKRQVSIFCRSMSCMLISSLVLGHAFHAAIDDGNHAHGGVVSSRHLVEGAHFFHAVVGLQQQSQDQDPSRARPLCRRAQPVPAGLDSHTVGALNGAAVFERAGVLAEHAGRHEFAASADLLHVLRRFGSHLLADVAACSRRIGGQQVSRPAGSSASMPAAMSIDPA